jgi:hypothetical protein
VFRAATRGSLAQMVYGEGGGAPLAGVCAEVEVHALLLRTFLEGHLGSERPLRTLDLFLQQVGE